ncbi:MAG: hypothetical protein U0736_12925 [Gemmataceae bacterium]
MLLVDGRKQLAAGKVDEAAQTAQRVKAMTTVSWGLFEDSPDRLAIDVEKARARRDRLEADRLLVDGRKLYEKGDYEAAARLAYRSQKLHGSYSIWELGDRPSKLLADIQTAQARSRKTALPPAALARKDNPKPTDKPATTDAAVAKNTTPPVPSGPSPEKLRAQQLVAEAQRLHRDGQLVAARQKVEEARGLKVTFAVDETSPEFVDQQLAIDARRRIDGLLSQAETTSSYGKGDAATRKKDAEASLEQARQMAVAFGQDVRPIETRLSTLRGTPSATPAGVALASHQTPVPEAPTPPVPGLPPVPGVMPTPTPSPEPGLPPVPGAATTLPGNERLAYCQEVLEKSRLELQKGDTAAARRLAEQALLDTKHGNEAVRQEAMALLRTIDVEEFNQKRLAANRAFDAALAAYRRREYGRASSMIAALDTKLLDDERQGRLREINLTPEMSPSVARAEVARQVGQPTAGTPAAKAPASDGASGLVRTGGSASEPTPSGPPIPVPPLPGSTDALPGMVAPPPAQLPGTAVARDGTPGRSLVADTADGGLLDIHRQRQKILFDKLRQDGLEVQREAADKFRGRSAGVRPGDVAGPPDPAERGEAGAGTVDRPASSGRVATEPLPTAQGAEGTGLGSHRRQAGVDRPRRRQPAGGGDEAEERRQADEGLQQPV